MKYRPWVIAALAAVTFVQSRADNFVTITPTGAAAATVVNRWVIGSNLSGLGYIDGNSGFPGATATNFFTLNGASVPVLGAPAGFTSYLSTGVATPQASVGNSLTPDAYSGLTYVAENLSLIGPLSFYAIHHRTTGDYLALIQPSVPTVSDQKPMSTPGNPLTPGASGYFALAYAADNPGGWGAQLFYYLRTNNLGQTVFGSLIPALLSGPTDRWNLGANLGFTDLAYTSTDVGFGFGPGQFYYLRLDPMTQTTFFGRLNPATGVATDIQNLGGVYRTLTFTPTNVGYGANQFYSIGSTSQAITFNAIADRTACDAAFTFVYPTASSGLAATIVVTGPANVSAGNTITLTGAIGIVTITASQAGNASFDAAVDVARSFNVAVCPPAPLTPQTITFGAVADRVACDDPFTFTLPTASSGLVVSLVVSGPATLSAGNLITLTGATGVVTITASQPGNGTFSAAANVARTFTVDSCPPPVPVAQTITFAAVPNHGMCDGTFTLSPTSSSGLPVALSVTSGLATVAGNIVTLTGTGNVTLRAVQAGNGTYAAASDVSRSFSVTKCTAPIVLGHLTKIYYGIPFDPLNCVLATTTPAGLNVTFTYAGSPIPPSAPGSYAVVATINSPTYQGTATDTLIVLADPRVPQTISFASAPANRVYGDAPFTVMSSSSSGLPTTLAVLSGPATVVGNTVTITGAGTVVLEASQSGHIETTFYGASQVRFTVAAAVGVVTSGNAVTLNVLGAANVGTTYQWQKNGTDITGATSSTLTVADLSAESAGIYVAAMLIGGPSVSEAIIVGATATAKASGAAAEIAANVNHPNGNIYDQVLLQGISASVTADAGQIVRISFIDLSNDIVQVEFSGAGILAINLANASGPAVAVNYNQPGVTYMKGHASIVVSGANETSHLSVYSVGRATAVNAALFRDDVIYDGVADLSYVAIASPVGRFGGVRAGNASFLNTRGLTGIYAPDVQFSGPVYVGEITSADTAIPVLILGSSSDVRITGGDLAQFNGQATQVNGMTSLQFTAGSTSAGLIRPAQIFLGRLERNGLDVTTALTGYN